MTCTTATQFAPHRRGSVLDGLIRRFEEWNNRRALYKVLQLDSHLLRDIGLTEGDIAVLKSEADLDQSIETGSLRLLR